MGNDGRHTDQVYAGLTWEWEPGASAFLDFSFGFSVHNGTLSNDNGSMGAVAHLDETRSREFGCRVLFRESLEGVGIGSRKTTIIR